MDEAGNSRHGGTRRYQKVKSYYETAIKAETHKKGHTLKSSARLPTNRAYHSKYSSKYRKSHGG
jgi:hypothetical protein